MSLLVIDISRGNNAHSDLQAAADALALAGARELDGGVTSIDRAIVAMSNVSNTVSFLGRTDEAAATTLTFDGGSLGPFSVAFLWRLPPHDDEPINFADCVTNDVSSLTCRTNQGDARFVYVRAESQELNPFFFLFRRNNTCEPDEQGNSPCVRVAAQAVATFRSAACDVTPLFICNPFEGEIGEDSLQVAFAEGRLHGRLIRLLPRGNGTAFPGNFGLLSSAEGNGVNTLRDIFATGGNRTCYDSGLVETQPGRPAAIRTGINVRFDMYDGNMNSNRNNAAYAPAANVRRGFIAGNGNNWCNAEPTSDETWTTGFPDNLVMQPPGVGTPGASVGTGNWPLDTYWSVNHPDRPALSLQTLTEITSFPGRQPSRYDVYRYEIESAPPTFDAYPFNLSGDYSAGNPSASAGQADRYRERGIPQCTGINPNSLSRSRDQDRRIIFAAVIDCLANSDNAGRSTLPVNSFASIFLVNPMLQGGANVEENGVIDVEVVDITGTGGQGTLDTFVRDEAILVR
jgi:hypothetical protein